MKTKTVLIVDDDKIIREQLQKELKREYFKTFLASDGKTALESLSQEIAIKSLRKGAIDYIEKPIEMDDMDGIEVIQRAKKLYRDIEGIVVTGFKDQELAIRSLRAGAIGYITKPVNLEGLLFSIKRAIERINLNRDRLYRNRELKISSEIISKMNEELERRIEERSKELNQTQAQPAKFDLVITDQTMPNMTGVELIKEMRRIRPDIPIVLCTGYSEMIDEAKAKEMGISFVMKPIVMSEIANTVREVLDKK